MYAVIRTGGKQYRVGEVVVDRLSLLDRKPQEPEPEVEPEPDVQI